MAEKSISLGKVKKDGITYNIVNWAVHDGKLMLNLEEDCNIIYGQRCMLTESSKVYFLSIKNLQPKQDTKLNETNNSKTGYWPPDQQSSHPEFPDNSEKLEKIERFEISPETTGNSVEASWGSEKPKKIEYLNLHFHGEVGNPANRGYDGFEIVDKLNELIDAWNNQSK